MYIVTIKSHLVLLVAFSLAAAAAKVSASSTRGYDETKHEAILPSSSKEDPRRVLTPVFDVGVNNPPFYEWSTSIDIYLDPLTSGGGNVDISGQGTRFDLSSAVQGVPCLPPDNAFLRDFMFHCGWYAVSAPGTGGQWFCSVSNNSVGNPKSANNAEILVKDWYTFTKTFKNVNGVLSVDLQILRKSTNGEVKKWTLSTLTDTIDIVGGPRYHWFVTLGCTAVASGSCTVVDPLFKLPIDNSKKCVKGFGCDFFQGFEVDTGSWTVSAPLFNGVIERVGSGTATVPSSTGNYHALVSGKTPIVDTFNPGPWTGPSTRFSGRCFSYAADKCCGTAEGAIVDASGCSDKDVDEDGDGVCNLGALTTGPSNLCKGEDLCPGTPATTIGKGGDAKPTLVNEIGCSDEQKEKICKSGKPGEKSKSKKSPGKKRF